MSAIIRVENLSKKFSIGAQEVKHDNLREVIFDTFSAPFRRLSGGGGTEGNDQDFWALRDVSFDVQEGDVVGIIGRNGAGKSTLLKILSKITEPTSGRVMLKGRMASLLEVGTGFHPELTGRENVYLNGAILGMSRKEINLKFDEIVDFSEIEKFLDTPVKRYSSGMYVRLAFAVAAHLDPDILIVDEVLAVGDAEFQDKCLGKMKDVSELGRTVLFVSHNVSALQKLCNKGVLLKNGVVDSIGNIDDTIRIYKDSVNKEFVADYKSDIKNLSVKQINDTITIELEYCTSKIHDQLILGFMVSDKNNIPVYGSNPVDCKLNIPSKYKNEGKVVINIYNPLLLDGVYYLSLWLNDGFHDFYANVDMLRFDIKNMTNKKFKRISHVGWVYPKFDINLIQ